MPWKNNGRLLPIGEVVVFAHKTGNVTAGTSAVQLLPADPNRVSVVLSAPGNTVVTLGLDPGVQAGKGLGLPVVSQPLHIHDDEFPGLAGQEMWVITTSANINVTYMYTKIAG